jgi:hypothetical protein
MILTPASEISLVFPSCRCDCNRTITLRQCRGRWDILSISITHMPRYQESDIHRTKSPLRYRWYLHFTLRCCHWKSTKKRHGGQWDLFSILVTYVLLYLGIDIQTTLVPLRYRWYLRHTLCYCFRRSIKKRHGRHWDCWSWLRCFLNHRLQCLRDIGATIIGNQQRNGTGAIEMGEVDFAVSRPKAAISLQPQSYYH